ncbi:1,4-dihydroxy-2-naphthoate octaprenyltransferase [invertebrate metagenome]|uniref:1,4-dihydroxy-2-naphthoate octaprenyltransferase n=1 Tax=invertebrate metagenome TaxID=1711999 RepID=A0A2H9T443_9ZZZZ
MDVLPDGAEKYRLIKALRPFSYSVALVSCGLGSLIAAVQEDGNVIRAVLVIVAGILLQAASNLANDYEDIDHWRHYPNIKASAVVRRIRFNFILAGILVLIAVFIGIMFASDVGWPLLVLGAVGIIGGYSYTGEPIHYKLLGLGVLGVFLFTGVLMVTGAYYAVAGVWNNQMIWISIPVSMLASALLMSNEIRDYQEDKKASIGTLIVRIGINRGKYLYVVMIAGVYPVSGCLYMAGLIHHFAYLLPSLLFMVQLLKRLLLSSSDELWRVPPLTGRFFMIFGVSFILSAI